MKYLFLILCFFSMLAFSQNDIENGDVFHARGDLTLNVEVIATEGSVPIDFYEFIWSVDGGEQSTIVVDSSGQHSMPLLERGEYTINTVLVDGLGERYPADPLIFSVQNYNPPSSPILRMSLDCEQEGCVIVIQ